MNRAPCPALHHLFGSFIQAIQYHNKNKHFKVCERSRVLTTPPGGGRSSQRPFCCLAPPPSGPPLTWMWRLPFVAPLLGVRGRRENVSRPAVDWQRRVALIRCHISGAFTSESHYGPDIRLCRWPARYLCLICCLIILPRNPSSPRRPAPLPRSSALFQLFEMEAPVWELRCRPRLRVWKQRSSDGWWTTLSVLYEAQWRRSVSCTTQCIHSQGHIRGVLHCRTQTNWKETPRLFVVGLSHAVVVIAMGGEGWAVTPEWERCAGISEELRTEGWMTDLFFSHSCFRSILTCQ